MPAIFIKTGVYCLHNRRNGKRYVGSAAKSLHQRMKSHRRELNLGRHPNEHLQNAWNKYGSQSFSFQILERCLPEQCVPREQFWINFYGSADRNRGYNKSPTAGSPLGFKHTVETKMKVSRALVGKKKSPEHAANIRSGKQHVSVETRQKMSLYAKNRSAGHLTKLSIAMRGNKCGSGRIVLLETREKIRQKAIIRWSKWKETGRSIEIGKKISESHRRRVSHASE